MNLNPIDIALIVILAVGFIWGFGKGIVYMLFSLIAIIGGIFAAGHLTPILMPTLFSEKDFQFGYIVLFILTFTLVYFIIRKLSHLAENMIEFMELEWLDNLLGGTVGLFQFLVIAGVLVSIATTTGLLHFVPNYEDIKFAFFVSDTSQSIINFIAGGIHQFKGLSPIPIGG